MSRSFRRLVGWRSLTAAISLLVALGCTKNDPPKAGTGGAGGGSGSGGASGAGGTPPPPPTGGSGGGAAPDAGRSDRPRMPKSCGDIRSCLWGCGQDAACASYCMTSAPAAALTTYKTVQMCSKQACPNQDADCRCEQECFAGGACFELIDGDCDMSASDAYCDEECH